MILNLKKVFINEEESLTFEYQMDMSNVKFDGCNAFIDPVEVQGNVENSDGIVTLNYKVVLNYYHPCDRCMNDVKQTFKYSFNHILCLKDNDSDLNEMYIILDEYELDLDKQVETDLFLELPSKVLCSDNCKGLCDKCGKDLNKGTCNCVTYQVDPRLEVLKDLID